MHHHSISTVKATTYNYVVALVACLGSFTQGFNSGIIAMILGQPSWYAYFNLIEPSHTAAMIDLCMGLYFLGGVLGCWSVNWLCDVFGRRRGIQAMVILIIVSAAIQSGSVHFAMFVVGRFVGGIGAGLIACAIPIYLAEIAPAAQRGRLVGLHGVFFVVALVSAKVPHFVDHLTGELMLSRHALAIAASESGSRRIRRSNGVCWWPSSSLHQSFC